MSRLEEITQKIFSSKSPSSIYGDQVFYGRAVENSYEGWVRVQLNLETMDDPVEVDLDREMDIDDASETEDMEGFIYTNDRFAYGEDLAGETETANDVLLAERVYPNQNDDINDDAETNEYNEPDPQCDVPDIDQDTGETETAGPITTPDGEMIVPVIGAIIPEEDVNETDVIPEPSYIGEPEPDEPDDTIMWMPTVCVVFENDICIIQVVNTRPTVIGVVGNGDLMQDEIDDINDDLASYGVRIIAVEGDASTAISTANTANTNASTALTTANSANTTAGSALSTANSASSTAGTALTTANTANTNAGTALTTAQTADGNATTALTTAQTADGNATTALSTANTANTNATSAINRVGTIETLIREYSQGVLVCKTNQVIGALVNANGSFDVCGLSWNGLVPTAGTVYASYGLVSVIGLTTQNHFTIENNRLIGSYNNEDNYFEVGDLRNQQLTSTFISDGTRYYTVYGASSISSVKNGSGTSLSYTTSTVSMGVRVNLSTAPTKGSKIIISYSTQNTKLPYMLFGSPTGQKGIFSVSFGDNNEASGYASSVFGRSNVASGYYATATGYNNTASGPYSFIEGTLNEAQGKGAHAEGLETKATGDSSHSEGSYTKAKGQDSHAEGNDTEARADFSHAGGQGTKAIGDAQTAIGRYNSTNTARAFIVGNGSSDTNRSNALALDWDGNMWITGNLSASGSLTVGSPIAVNMGGTGQTAVETISTISSIITADSNWTITACYIYKWGKMVMFRCLAKPTNAVSGSGNVVGTIKSAYRPAVQAMAVYGYNNGCRIMTNGEVQMSGSVSAGTSITISSTYLLA